MKHAPLMAAFLCVVCALPLAAQSITVTRPPAPDNSPCIKGQTCTIAWTVTGQPGGPGIIELLEETTTNVVRTIKTDVQIANHQYAWTVPGDVDPGKYRVRVRVYWVVVSQPGSVFTIQAQSGGLHAGGLHGELAPIVPIHILEPTKTAVWTIGETHTIRWSATDAVKYPLWLFLVSKDHKIPIVDIGKATPTMGFRPTQKSWTVTDNLYEQEYCIRITSADDPVVQVHSQPFQIKASRIVKFQVTSPAVANKVKWHKFEEAPWGYGDNQPFTSGGPTPVPDPGDSMLKYGYQRWYQDDDNRGYYLHRSFVQFDPSSVVAQLKHKWTVYRAFVSWNKAPNSPQGCAPVIFCLDAPMGNLNDSMFGPTFAAFPKHPISGDQAILVQMAKRWLEDPSKNYGLVVLAANEGQPHENGQCVTYTTPATMEIEIEEKLNN